MFNFNNVTPEALMQLAQIADPDYVMELLDQQSPLPQAVNPSTTPAYAVQDQLGDSVFGSGTPPQPAATGPYNGYPMPPPSPPVPTAPPPGPWNPDPTANARGTALDVASLGLLANMNRQTAVPRVGPAGLPGPGRGVQFNPLTPFAIPPSRRPDLGAILFGGNYGRR
jgi:hypothetical protein